MIEIFYFDKGLKKGAVKDLENLKKKQVWLDISNISKGEAKLVKDAFGLHPLTTEDLISKNTRIKVEEFSNYLFCVFYGIQKTKSIGLVELDLVLGKNFVISSHLNKVDLIEELKNNKERLENLFKKGIDFIFHKLLDNEVDNYLPVLENIDDQIEYIEDEVTKRPRAEQLKKILKLKRLIVLIKKTTLPQREKISFLAKNDYRFISKKAIPYFRDIYDHSIRVSDTIDNYREALGNTFDAYMSSVSNNMNEVMKVLSVIATIALPLSVISGIFGTNFSNLPGSTFVYGFWAMIFFMILLSLGMIYYFKRKGWF